MAPISEKAKVIQLASITSSPAYTNAGDYIFRNAPSSAYYTAKSADEAYERGYKKVSVLYENKDFPVGAYEAFAGQFTKLGGSILSHTAFNSNENDLRSYILKINTEKPDAIFFSAQGPAAMVAFLKQMKELSLLNKYPIITSAQGITPDINQQTNGLLNNPKIFTTDAYTDPVAGKTPEFIKNYKAVYGVLPPTNLAYLTSSYDSLYVIKDAMESCKSATDNECIKNFLYNLKDWEGAAGLLSFDKNGDAFTPIGLHYFDEKGEEIWKELK
jgi:branched-chain amino acid transport system substrate-binding protein